MAQQMVVRASLNAHVQLGGMGPIQLHHLPGSFHLGEEHLLVWTVTKAPLFDPSLESAQMRFLQPALRRAQQILKNRLGFELGRVFEHLAGLLPDLGERIAARAPGVFVLKLLWRFARLPELFAGGLTIHPRFHSADCHISLFLVLLAELI